MCTLLEAFAWTRIALGAAAMVAPAPVAAAFGLGDDEHMVMPARMLGGRDLAMGLGIILAERHGGSTRGWLEAGVLVDTVDGLATAHAYHRGLLTPCKALQVGAVIAGSILVGAWLVNEARRQG